NALKIVSTDSLRSSTPILILEPLIFRAGFKAEGQIETPRLIEGNILDGIPDIDALGGISKKTEVLLGMIDRRQQGAFRIRWRTGRHRLRRLGESSEADKQYRGERDCYHPRKLPVGIKHDGFEHSIAGVLSGSQDQTVLEPRSVRPGGRRPRLVKEQPLGQLVRFTARQRARSPFP